MTVSGRSGGNSPEGTLFPYWSFSKTAIAICALKLVEEHLLDLDALYKEHPFTLRHLLSHSSGLPDYGSLKKYHAAVARGDQPWPRQKLLDATLAQDMHFPPGEGWSYSNIGYLFVRDLIEGATGKPLGDVIHDLICNPLGLASVEFWDTLDQSAALHWDDGARYDPRWVYHGCLIGSAPDAARLLHALFAGNLLGSETLNDMLVRRSLGGAIPGRPWTECGYALGLMSGAMGGLGRAIGHTGAGPFSVNAVYHFPDLPDPTTIAAFTNATDQGVAEFSAAGLARDH
ncbi:serine hydrolase domain-containing protein [Loktanella atrilutea]|uniref:serine hydrolase domain-containing protein n=1 Tax=Loktanella atrilutea TaxID=366533 RepID=UPI001C4A07B7|nr:serine hydrolase domain-containing protein [Loktanella atrilutea]